MTSGHFLLRFIAASSLGMGLWLWWGVDYVGYVAPAVNMLAAWLEVPFRLVQEADQVLYAYSAPGGRSFRLLATGQESIYLNLVTAGAVFAAIPHRPPGWRLGWTALALGLLWMTHVVSFYAGGSIALWQFAQSGPEALSLAQPLAVWLPAGRSQWYLQALEIWNLWGRYGLCIVLWIIACSTPSPAPVPATVAEIRPLRWILRPTTT